jgi:hypothetical protein
MIERHYQIPFVSRLALNEKQIQQNYRPLIAVHKWFARRPGTLFRALLLSELGGVKVEESYFKAHNFHDTHILDPFMGGGTTVVEANRLGCRVTASDINPMAWWIVRQEILDLDLSAYRAAAAALREHLRTEIGHLYQTICPKTGRTADVKYFLWVKEIICKSCREPHQLFPNFLVAEDVRHTANVFVCGHCGALFEAKDRKNPGPCPTCHEALPVDYTAGRNRSRCLKCRAEIQYPTGSPPEHHQFALEYHLPKDSGEARIKGRLFKAPDAADLAKFREASEQLLKLRPKFIPTDAIPSGDETGRLHRWGYSHYRELFNARQLLGLELSCRWISKLKDERVREALATNLSDLLRYQNMLCRYDTMALKSLDIFSVHGFPVGLVQCESNLLGIEGTSGQPVGSGGWLNITEKFTKAKSYCARPFEFRHEGGRKTEVPIVGEWIGTYRNGSRPPERRQVDLQCTDSSNLPDAELAYDGIFTDPPYFGNVQYAELMDFCYVWLRKLLGGAHKEFTGSSTRNVGELTGNLDMGRDLAHFTEGLSATFCKTASRLKSGRPFVFTYHHNSLDAYVPLAVAILDARLTCSASLPCPAEMGASIHINGTGSSVIDTVFVCRSTGIVPARWIVSDSEKLSILIRNEIQELELGGLNATQGDIRCMCHGHMIRLAVWNLRHGWNLKASTIERMNAVRNWLIDFGGVEGVLAHLKAAGHTASPKQSWQPVSAVAEDSMPYEITF